MTTLSDQCTSTGNDVDISMLNTEEFFAYSSYRASSPLPPQLSFEEELEQRPDNDFYRLLRKVEAEKSAKLKRKAEDLGFASWEEKESHDREKKRKRLEDYVREHGHPPPQRVYTKEEEAALKLQAERSLALDIKSKLGPGLHCDCEGSCALLTSFLTS